MLVATHIFGKIFAACNIERYCSNTVGKSNRLDLPAVFRRPSYVSATRFSTISLWFIFCKKFPLTKTNTTVTFQEDLLLLEESLLLFEDTQREKAPSNKTPALAKSMNMDIWILGALN